jgi:hypothetical protein
VAIWSGSWRARARRRSPARSAAGLHHGSTTATGVACRTCHVAAVLSRSYSRSAGSSATTRPAPWRRSPSRRGGLTARHQRRTIGLRSLLERVALALAGRAGSRLARALGAIVSRCTLIRLIRALPDPEIGEVAVPGVDDWAKRRGQSYASVLPGHGHPPHHRASSPTGRPAPSPSGSALILVSG